MEQSAVIKSKVDISRNLNGYSFPHKLSSQEAEIGRASCRERV